jgi:hypothetical protein
MTLMTLQNIGVTKDEIYGLSRIIDLGKSGKHLERKQQIRLESPRSTAWVLSSVTRRYGFIILV